MIELNVTSPLSGAVQSALACRFVVPDTWVIPAQERIIRTFLSAVSKCHTPNAFDDDDTKSLPTPDVVIYPRNPVLPLNTNE